MIKSKIFTNAEMQNMDERIAGSKKDSTGIFSARIKPKIIELLKVWFPKKKQLEKLVNKKWN